MFPRGNWVRVRAQWEREIACVTGDEEERHVSRRQQMFSFWNNRPDSATSSVLTTFPIACSRLSDRRVGTKGNTKVRHARDPSPAPTLMFALVFSYWRLPHYLGAWNRLLSPRFRQRPRPRPSCCDLEQRSRRRIRDYTNRRLSHARRRRQIAWSDLSALLRWRKREDPGNEVA